MAASMEFTFDEGDDETGNRRHVRKVVATWVSASDGTASNTIKMVGRLVKAVTNPGSAAPTDNYDVTLTDEDGIDVLAGCDDDLADRDTTTTEEVYFLVKDHAAGTPLAQSVAPVVCGDITVAVANAGDTKNGTISLYFVD